MVKYEKLNNYMYINDNELCIEITQQNDFFEYLDVFIDESEINVSRETLCNISDKFNKFIKKYPFGNVAIIIYERDENGIIDVINKMFLIHENGDIFGIDLKNCKLMF